MEYSNINPNQSGELAFDLRQIYAHLVGEHMQDISESRKADNFYAWYKSIEDLHTIVKHKFKKKDKDEKEYNSKKKELVDLANKYSSSWLGTSKNSKERAILEEALRQLEEFLYDKMQEAKMFGESGRIAGL